MKNFRSPLCLVVLPALAFVLMLCLACTQFDSGPEVTVPSEGTVTAITGDQPTQPSSTPTITFPTSFEDALLGEAVTKYKGLPVEFQDALREEAELNGNEKAVQYLLELPDDIIPLSELLDGYILDIYQHLDPSYQRLLLLEGYPYSTNTWLKSNVTEEDRFNDFGEMVLTLNKIVSGDGEVSPPLEDTMSPEAIAKLEIIDPMMRQSFRLIWESTRTHPRMGLAEELEQDLLAAPAGMPAIEDLTLPAEAIELLEVLPDLRTIVRQMIAAEVLRNQKWDEEDTAGIVQFLVPFYTEEAKARFERGLSYHTAFGMDPLICGSMKPQVGIALPTWAIPAPFRDVPWTHLMFRWPDPEQALSEEALSKLRSMDPLMQDTFENYWYGTGPLPRDAGEMACSVAQWERGIIYAPFTSLPAPEEIFSPEGLEMYRNLTPSLQDELWGHIIYQMLKDGIVWYPEKEEAVPTYGTPIDEILTVLKSQCEYSVRSLAKRATSNASTTVP